MKQYRVPHVRRIRRRVRNHEAETRARLENWDGEGCPMYYTNITESEVRDEPGASRVGIASVYEHYHQGSITTRKTVTDACYILRDRCIPETPTPDECPVYRKTIRLLNKRDGSLAGEQSVEDR